MPIGRFTLAVAVLAVVGVAAELAAATAPKPTTDISTNWAGYSLTDTETAPVSFTAATATWKQPALKCGARNARSAIWVGLGGVNSVSGHLEQIGSNADCKGGKAQHVAFYEVTPYPGVRIPRFRINAGDLIVATVSVEVANQVQFRIENVTKRRGFTISVPVDRPERRSAEWIVEAPAGCIGSVCGQADLANFGSVTFTRLTAVGNGHPGSVLDPRWHATAVSLTPSRREIAATGLSHGAVPRALAADGTAFTIEWRAHTKAPSLTEPKLVPAKPGGPYVAGPRLPG